MEQGPLWLGEMSFARAVVPTAHAFCALEPKMVSTNQWTACVFCAIISHSDSFWVLKVDAWFDMLIWTGLLSGSEKKRIGQEFKLRFCFTDVKMWCKCITSICVAWYVAVTVEHQWNIFTARKESTKYLWIYKVVVNRIWLQLRGGGGTLYQQAALFSENATCHKIVLTNIWGMLMQRKKNRAKPMRKLCQFLSSLFPSSSLSPLHQSKNTHAWTQIQQSAQ